MLCSTCARGRENEVVVEVEFDIGGGDTSISLANADEYSGVNDEEVEARTGGGGGGATTVVAALEMLLVLNGWVIVMLVWAEVTVEPLRVRERMRKGLSLIHI